jgi:hypothetical protein
VGGGFAVGYAVTVRDAFAVSDVSFAVGNMTLRGAVAVAYAFTVGAAFTMARVIARGAFAVAMGSEVVVGGDAIVGGVIIVAVDYDVAQELARCAGVPTVSHVPQTLCCGQQGR